MRQPSGRRNFAAGLLLTLTAGAGIAVQAQDNVPPPPVGFTPLPTEQAPATAGCQAGNSYEGCSLWERWQIHRAERKRYKQEQFWGYPEEFCEPPLGIFMEAHRDIQIQNAVPGKMVLYKYDFVPDTADLNARGKRQLAKIAALIPQNQYPVIIEQSDNAPALNAARHMAVMQELALTQIPIVPERVVVGVSPTVGLQGNDAAIIRQNFGRQIQAGGAPSLSGGTFNFRSGAGGSTTLGGSSGGGSSSGGGGSSGGGTVPSGY